MMNRGGFMAIGIIYIMSTVVPGLIKIGKTGIDNFERRMYNLERHGYNNVVGLKREFAIELDDYDEKEKLLDDIFSKSRVLNSELFALDLDLVIQLLSSFEGRQVYPVDRTKETTFDEATKARAVKVDWEKVPDGYYYLNETRKGFGVVTATMKVEDGMFTVLKGSICAPTKSEWMPDARKSALIENDTLLEDVSCNSPSTAGWVVLGNANNGWTVWKNESGDSIDIYR
jgi:hypothetical protein